MENNTKKYKDIYLVRYLNGERNFKREQTVFDLYRTEELLGEAKALEIFNIYFEKTNINKAYVSENDAGDLTTIQIDEQDLDNELKALSNEIIVQSLNLGSDDDTFDYFPDLVFAFQQICEQYKRFDIYNELVDQLNKKIYNELDEPFYPIEDQDEEEAVELLKSMGFEIETK